MSVFTQVSRAELETFLSGYALGALLDYQGISGGSENSNFFVTTEAGRFVLTLIERDPVARELPFFIQLLDALHAAGLPVPYALRDRDAEPLHQLHGKPALLQPRFDGGHVERPGISHCTALGRILGRLHRATQASGLKRVDDRGPGWVLAEGVRALPELNADEAGLLNPVLDRLLLWQAQPPSLPWAVLHADLFRDNVMFEGERLTGVIDFYNAASGWCLYDLAIAANDWCMDAADSSESKLNPGRATALLEAYAALRPFTAEERDCWPMMLRLAAVRFWLSRRIAAAEHDGQSGVLIKDPQHFVRVLQAHRAVSLPLPV